MSLWKKILLGCGVFLVVLIALFAIVVGPWPTYSSGFEGARYYNTSIAAIDKGAQECQVSDKPGRLKAGWGVALINPETGVPLAGYSARKGKPSTGVHDDLCVKAVAFSDGTHTAVVVGADMLLVPPNIAEMVRQQVAQETPLKPDQMLFTASHTHDGPGGFAPGLIARISFGPYNPKVPIFLAKAFTTAIVAAYNTLEPAKIAHGGVNAQQFIHNRTRNAPVDPELSYLVIEKENGKRCFVTSFSAHPTILDDDNMQFTAEYPGYLQRAIEKATGGTCVYLGGAVGSMGPHAPEGPNPFARCQAMGEGLAKLILDNTQDMQKLQWQTDVNVASISVPIALPPFQVRIMSTKWRLSPLLAPIVGLRTTGWMSLARVGDVLFVASPGDFSGEISATWKSWAAEKGFDLWVSGFSGEYAGYISPDKYYAEVTDEKGNTKYETGAMSWTGPHQEAYFTALMRHMVDDIGKAPGPQHAGQSASAPADAKSST